MKNQLKTNFLIVSLFFIFSSFSINRQIENNNLEYVFKKGNKIMKLEFDTEKKYLELNHSTTLKISFTNISVNDFTIMGIGIKMIAGGKSFSKCEVTPIKEYLVDNHLEISLFERKNGKYELFHKVLVPVK